MKEEILLSLEPLFKEAAEKGLWFRCSYQDLIFSPAELRKAQQEDRFLWGDSNWRLFDPAEHLVVLESNIEEAKRELERFKVRLNDR